MVALLTLLCLRTRHEHVFEAAFPCRRVVTLALVGNHGRTQNFLDPATNARRGFRLGRPERNAVDVLKQHGLDRTHIDRGNRQTSDHREGVVFETLRPLLLMLVRPFGAMRRNILASEVPERDRLGRLNFFLSLCCTTIRQGIDAIDQFLAKLARFLASFRQGDGVD